jgi:hypothetical protein
MAIKVCAVATNICWPSACDLLRHVSGSWEFEVAPRFLENLCREDINLKQFLLLFFLGGVINPVRLPWTLFAFEFPLGTSEAFFCFMLVLPLKIIPPVDMSMRQIPFVVILMSSEGKVSQEVRFDTIFNKIRCPD